MQPVTVGGLRIVAVVERAGPTRPTWLLPDAVPEAVERHRAWLAPHFLDERGRFLQSIHTFVVQAPGLTVLVDTCVGNDKDRGGRAPFHMMRTTFLDDLRAAGVAPESVDVVICTHLHVDHVGWNTRLDGGRWCRRSRAPATCSRGASGSTGRPSATTTRDGSWTTA